MLKDTKSPFSEHAAWSALQYPVFRTLWICLVISNIGSWMHEVGAAWLMTSLTTKPIYIAMVQGATALAVCLFALPAGALADILDRRRYIIVLQSWMMLVAATLAILTYLGKMTPQLLLGLTFCLGMGTALTGPTWQTIISELVPAKHLSAAITLNGVGTNISRAIGPAIAGIIILALGPYAVFAINALSFFVVITALFKWKRQPFQSNLPAERLFSAIRSGVRYVRRAPTLHNVLIKSSGFFIFASCLWALLPLIARKELHCDALGYALLLSSFGIGAVLGAFSLPFLIRTFQKDKVVLLGALHFSIGALLLALMHNFYFALLGMLFAGMAWITVLATLNTVAQQSVSMWVRARAISVYLMIFFAGMAVGSYLWGVVATHVTLATTQVIAAIGLIASSLITYRFTLDGGEIDHTPTLDSPAPHGHEEPRHDQGPIMITIEYHISPHNVRPFTHVMRELRQIRLREGAFFWALFHDIESPNTYIECFMSETWLEHLRFHERLSVSDRRLIVKAKAFHEDTLAPIVKHYVGQDIPKQSWRNQEKLGSL